MTNYFYYGLLSFTCLCLLGYTLWRIPNRKIFALYTFMSGSTYLIEYIIMILLNSYAYHPEILADKYFDSVLRAIISDALVVPIAATFIGAFQLGLPWIITIVGIFLLIEKVFVNLNLYTQNWWSLTFTGIVLFVGFLLAKKWYRLLQTKLTLFVRFATLYFTTILLWATTGFVLSAFLRFFLFEIGWFQNSSRDHIAFYGIYIILLPVLFALFVVFHVKWRWRISFLSLFIAVDWLLEKWSILHIAPGWNLVYFFLLRVVFLWLIERYDKIVLKTKT